MPRVGFAWAPTRNTSVNVAALPWRTDVLYDNLGILSAPPQLQQTCDVVGSGDRSLPGFTVPLDPHGRLAPGRAYSTINASPNHQSRDARGTAGYVPNQTLPYSETWTLASSTSLPTSTPWKRATSELAVSISRSARLKGNHNSFSRLPTSCPLHAGLPRQLGDHSEQ